MNGHRTPMIDDLEALFRRPAGTAEKIGIEVECGLVDPVSGHGVRYGGRAGGRALLQAILDQRGGEPVFEGANLLGVVLPDGAAVSLEMGGAVEYSSVPCDSLVASVAKTRAEIEFIAVVAAGLGIAVLSGSMLPFTSMDSIPWIPKGRLQIMRDYFARLGDDGSLSDSVMGLTLSTQASLDYISAEDLAAKLAMQALASPVAAALFVNSPIEAGRMTGALSRRMQLWRKIDPRRCGVLPFAIRRELTKIRASDIVEWAAALPMIYRREGASHNASPGKPFRDLLRDGYDDGTRVSEADWESHLSQVWPHVRVRRTLELRLADGPAWPDFGAVPAFWTGLTYHRPSLHAAWEMLRSRTLTELEATTDEVAVTGLAARLGPDSVRDLARELVRLASRGLSSRVEEGLEPASAIALLDPVAEVAESGRTFAAACADRWLKDLAQSPARYVGAYRVPPHDS